MIISNCPACVNGTGCCSPHTKSVECEKVDDCVIKQIVNDMCEGNLSGLELCVKYSNLLGMEG